ADRLVNFVAVDLPGGDRVEFLPGLRRVGKSELDGGSGELRLDGPAEIGHEDTSTSRIYLLVLVAGADQLLDTHAETVRLLVRRHDPLVVTCVDRASLAALRSGTGGVLQEVAPDIVVFDESFVDHAVPFSAFTARKSLFDCWNRPGRATFHSTTFQPNTI